MTGGRCTGLLARKGFWSGPRDVIEARGRPPLGGELAIGAKHVDSIVSAGSLDLTHDTAQVVFNGELRQIEIGSNFFIREAFGDKADQLKLARGESLLAGALRI